MIVDGIELKCAKHSISNILPNLNWDVVISQRLNKEIELDDLLSYNKLVIWFHFFMLVYTV